MLPQNATLINAGLSNEVNAKVEGFEKQVKVVHEKISALDRHVAHLNSGLEEVVRQVEQSNRYTANQLFTQNMKLNSGRSGITGSLLNSEQSPNMSSLLKNNSGGSTPRDLQQFASEIANDKQDILREPLFDREHVK